MFTSSTKREINYFHIVVVQWRQWKKCTKRHDARAKLLFCQSNPFAFLPFSLTSMKSLFKLPNKCHFMKDGKSDNTMVTLTKFWRVYHSQSMKRGRTAFFTAFMALEGVTKGAKKYRGKTVGRGTGTPAFCVLTRTIFLPPPPPFHSERPQRRPIDLNSLHVLFSHGGSCLFIVRAYTCAWIRRILRETVLKSFITGPTLRKQNMQAKEVYCVPNNQRSLQTSGERGYAELSQRRTDYNSSLHLLNP